MTNNSESISPSAVRILVVDDHADSAKALARLLQMRGYLSEWFCTAAEAIDAATRTRFDVLICDIQMPGCDGYELLRRIQSTQRIPAIALSGHCYPGDVQKSIDAGFTFHVKKPVDAEVLFHAIERCAR